MRSYQTELRSRGGFTLVELLVVVGIIALLIAMLMPALGKARFQAKVVSCGSNHRQIYAALAMYANDHRGALPGTNAWQNVKGGDYFNSWGMYPWEVENNGYNESGQPVQMNIDPGRWYGIGKLIGSAYLPPNRVVECADFHTDSRFNAVWIGAGEWRDANFSANGSFQLSEIVTASGGDAPANNTFPNQGSYVLNTHPFYSRDPSNRANGKIGRPGRNGGWNDMGPVVPHITAYIMCLSTTGIVGVGDTTYPAMAHEMRGVNVTYIDGSVKFMEITPTEWIYYSYSGVISTAWNTTGNRGMWALASLKQ